METAPDLNLSPSEKRTLQRLAANDGFDASEVDWVALQRLKKLGLAEDRAAGVRITAEGGACFGGSAHENDVVWPTLGNDGAASRGRRRLESVSRLFKSA